MSDPQTSKEKIILPNFEANESMIMAKLVVPPSWYILCPKRIVHRRRSNMINKCIKVHQDGSQGRTNDLMNTLHFKDFEKIH